MNVPSEEKRIEHNRVIWHSRRGMLELDLVLEPFARDCYALLDEAAQLDYRRLLACEDQQLFDWLLQKRAVDEPGLACIVERVLRSHAGRANTRSAKGSST